MQGILNRTKCVIHVFDPTLTAKQKAAVEAVPGVHLHEYGLGDKNGWVDTGGDKSMTLGKTVAGFTTKTLATIMEVSIFQVPKVSYLHCPQSDVIQL